MDFQRPLAWNLSRAALGPVFSASLAGLMIGLLIIGPLSDHVGRKLAIEHLRAERLHEKVKPLLRPLWLFFVARCYALQEEDNELSATDAFWLGLIDEVVGGPPDLFPFRWLIENVPDPGVDEGRYVDDHVQTS